MSPLPRPQAGRRPICRPPRRAPRLVRLSYHPGLIVLALLLIGTAQCGRRTPPRPVKTLLLPVAGLAAHQREEEILVSWRIPSGSAAQEFAAPRGFIVWVETFDLACAGRTRRCAARYSEELELTRGDGAFAEQGGRAYWRHRPQSARGIWRFRVAARYRDGTSEAAISPLVRGLNPIPRHDLRWEWSPAATGGGRGKPRALRLSWAERRESVVQVISEGGAPVKRDRLYRTNLYRRPEGESWPMAPLNDAPIEARFWIDRPAADFGGNSGVFEYTLRLVDQFGGEGPPAPALRVVFGERGQ